MQTDWIQASIHVTSAADQDSTCLPLRLSFSNKKQYGFQSFKLQMTLTSLFRILPSIQRVFPGTDKTFPYFVYKQITNSYCSFHISLSMAFWR